MQEREPAALVAPAGRLLLAELEESGRRGRRRRVALRAAPDRGPRRRGVPPDAPCAAVVAGGMLNGP